MIGIRKDDGIKKSIVVVVGKPVGMDIDALLLVDRKETAAAMIVMPVVLILIEETQIWMLLPSVPYPSSPIAGIPCSHARGKQHRSRNSATSFLARH